MSEGRLLLRTLSHIRQCRDRRSAAMEAELRRKDEEWHHLAGQRENTLRSLKRCEQDWRIQEQKLRKQLSAGLPITVHRIERERDRVKRMASRRDQAHDVHQAACEAVLGCEAAMALLRQRLVLNDLRMTSLGSLETGVRRSVDMQTEAAEEEEQEDIFGAQPGGGVRGMPINGPLDA